MESTEKKRIDTTPPPALGQERAASVSHGKTAAECELDSACHSLALAFPHARTVTGSVACELPQQCRQKDCNVGLAANDTMDDFRHESHSHGRGDCRRKP